MILDFNNDDLYVAHHQSKAYMNDSELSVSSIIVNQGMRLKRMKPRARGRADRIIKPTCHIEIILTEEGK